MMDKRNFFLLLVLCTIAVVAAWPQEKEDVESLPAWAIQLQEIVAASDATDETAAVE